MYLTEKFARLVVNTAYADLPSRAVEKAKECILDCVGVAIAGSAEPVRGPLLHYLNAIGGAEEATIVGLGRRTSITNAALVNGVFGHVLDYDDTNLHRPRFGCHRTHDPCARGEAWGERKGHVDRVRAVQSPDSVIHEGYSRRRSDAA